MIRPGPGDPQAASGGRRNIAPGPFAIRPGSLPDIRDLDVFVRVARLGSVQAAAIALGISQPAASRRIAHVQRLVGCQLLARKRGRRQARTLALTGRGEEYMEAVGPIVDAMHRLCDRMPVENKP